MRSYTNDIFGAPDDAWKRAFAAAQTSPRPFIPRPAPPEWKSAEESYHEYCERIRRQEWEAAQTSPRHPVAADGEQTSRILALPTEHDERKKLPIATGVIDYFPDAFVALSEVSRIGNDKHNPGMPLHWSRGKSDDHPDALMRHFIERGKMDVNGVRHSAQVAWRALAILQLELEKAAIDAMEENAWRLQREAHTLHFTAAPMMNEWRQGDAVRARGWPDIPPAPQTSFACKYPDCDGGNATGYCHPACRDYHERLIGLPCDVEPGS